MTNKNNSKTARKGLTLSQTLPYILMIAGVIGLLASFVLTYDKIQVLKNIGYDPPCNINPIFSCGSVMKTEQANLLGVPNTLFGIVGFTALTTVGFLFATGSLLGKRMWQMVQVVATIGVIFMHYLFFQGVYRINAICPWCFVVWMITIPVFWYITLYNLRERNIVLPGKLKKIEPFIQKNHGNILLVWYLIIFGILLEHFWYYWSTLL
jgi:uncharacterized membrane protein